MKKKILYTFILISLFITGCHKPANEFKSITYESEKYSDSDFKQVEELLKEDILLYFPDRALKTATYCGDEESARHGEYYEPDADWIVLDIRFVNSKDDGFHISYERVPGDDWTINKAATGYG